MGQVIDDSLVVIKRRWGWLAAITIVAWAPGFSLTMLRAAYGVRGSYPPLGQAASFVGVNLLWMTKDTLAAGVALALLFGRPSLRNLPRSIWRGLPALLTYWLLRLLPSLIELSTPILAQATRSRSLTLASEFLLARAGVNLACDFALFIVLGPYLAVVLAESPNPSEAMLRSWRLLSGSRWRVALIWVAFTVASLALLAAAGAAFIVLLHQGLLPIRWPVMQLQLQAISIISGAVDVVWSVTLAAIYVGLHRLTPAPGATDVDERATGRAGA